MGVNPPSLPEVERRLDEILARPEFSGQSSSLLARVFTAISDFFRDLFSSIGAAASQLGPWSYVFLALLAASAALAVVWLLRRRARGRGRTRAQKKAAPAERAPTSAEWLARADQLAAAGTWPEAAAALMAALLARLGECRLIVPTPGRTNRQYLADLRRAGYRGAAAFAAFSVVFASWRYGGQPVEPALLAHWRRALTPLFEGGAAA
ncbi:MAG: DUF4129 domain-containing protein [Oscillospiraceae bacterium]|jgi:uncharacterized membrane protein|nr:DUF4129 domain-containing protein [Oscillospiraceae bacterium]